VSTARAPGLVDVVVPTYDAGPLLLSCVEHLLPDPAIGRVIVVDDVSADGTLEALRERFPEAAGIALPEHRGLAHACNAGAAAATAEYVLFLNNDIFAERGAVRRLVQALAAHPAAVSAGGRLVDAADGRTQDAYRPRDFPGLAALAIRLLGVERLWPANPWTGGHLRRPLGEDAPVEIHGQPAGACLLVRRAALEAVGGWDERFWFWYEDVDLSRRLDGRGPALYVPSAVFRHVGRHSTSRWAKPTQHRRLYHGTLTYGLTHLRAPARVALAALVAGVCLPRIPWYAARGRPEAAAIYRELIGSALRVAAGRRLDVPADARRRRDG
jgi:GT2 family glycosyltransferase